MVSARTRLAISGVVGVVCGLAASSATAWYVAALAGWDGAAATFTGWVWFDVWGRSAESTRCVATTEDPGRAAADVLLLGASVASLLGAGVTLLEAANSRGAGTALLVGLATLSVAVSWFVVHTVFMLRYARLYYSGTPGGVDFPGDELATYRDFAYLALTLGMTFQVSDTDLSSPVIRASALRHALLSYLFGVCIVGLTINVVAGLLK